MALTKVILEPVSFISTAEKFIKPVGELDSHHWLH